MNPTLQQLRRELELVNLAEALRRGWQDDPRWQAALERIREEQEAEAREKLRGEEGKR